MSVDLRIRRAAGYIVWKQQRGEDLIAAIAHATLREPDLNDDEIRQAVRYASAAMRFAELAAKEGGCLIQKIDPETGRLSFRCPDGDDSVTLGQVIEAAGLTPFKHKRHELEE